MIKKLFSFTVDIVLGYLASPLIFHFWPILVNKYGKKEKRKFLTCFGNKIHIF